MALHEVIQNSQMETQNILENMVTKGNIMALQNCSPVHFLSAVL